MADLIQPDVSVFRTIAGPLLQPQTPADWQAEATRAQAAQALAQEQRARAQAAAEDRATKARKAAEEQADAQLLQQLAQKHKGDPDLMLTELRAVNPRVAMKFDADWTDVKKKNIDLVTADNKNQREKLGKHMGLLKLLEQRPDLYPVVKATIDKEDPSMSPYLPAEYDPAKIAPLFQMAHTAESILETDKLALQYLVEGKWHQAVAMAFADKTMGPEQVAQKAAELIQMRVPRQVVDSFDWQHWTPDFAARALERGRTPEQRANAAAQAAEQARDNARADATAAETARHHGVIEAQGRTGSRAAEPIVQVVGPDGKVVWTARSQAIGKEAPRGSGGASGEGGALPPRVETTVRSLSTAFRNEPAVKRAVTMGEAVSFVSSLDTNTKNPADDQALIYAFAKAMDPESVVREGEYATVAKYAQSWLEKFGFDAMRVLSSNAPILTSAARENLKKTITGRFNASRGTYDNLVRSYTGQINKATGLDDAMERLTDYGAVFPGGAPAATPGPETTRGGSSGPPRVTATPADYSAYKNRKRGG